MIPGHLSPLGPDHCALCRRYHSDPAYRALVDGRRRIPSRPVAFTVICDNHGEDLQATAIVQLGLDPAIRTVPCAAGRGTVPGFVQPCRECSAMCADYAPPADRDQDDD